jgi:hypothetical protein
MQNNLIVSVCFHRGTITRLILILLISFLPVASAHADITSNLIAWWKFDDGHGTNAADSAGTNTGTLSNSPVWIQGRLGDALQFNGSNQSVTTAGNEALGTAFTISCWFNETSDTGNIQALIGNKNSGAASGWTFFLNTFNTSDHRIYFEARNGTGEDAKTNAAVFNNGVWYHVAVVVSDSTSSQISAIYLNGVSQTLAANTLNSGFNATAAPRIGEFTSGNFPMSGDIDDVRIYTRALSAADIQQLYGLGHTRQLNHAHLVNFKTS